MSLSSRGLGHCPFTAGTGVRTPLGTPIWSVSISVSITACHAVGTSSILVQTAKFGGLAQLGEQLLLEQLAFNQLVEGSNPTLSARDNASVVKFGRRDGFRYRFLTG